MNNFISSPVLREFYQTALKKGWVKDELEKQAASSEIKPVGDLDCDVVCLINNLKKRGMNSEASSLEKKFLIYKEAQFDANRLIDNESKNLLELAHAANTKIVDTQSGMGEIHTDLDRQRKIIETLNHQPNGNLLRSAAEVLGLVKTSQEVEKKNKEIDNTLNESLISPEEEFDAIASPEQKEAVNKINQFLYPNIAAINSIATALNTYISELTKNAFKDELKNNASALSYYAKIIGVPSSEISVFLNSWDRFRGKNITGELSKMFSQMKSINQGSLIPPNLVTNYITGTNYRTTSEDWDTDEKNKFNLALNSMKSSDSRFIYNPNSIYTGVVSSDLGDNPQVYFVKRQLNNEKIEELAQALSNYLDQQFGVLFSAENLTKARESLLEGVDKSLFPQLNVRPVLFSIGFTLGDLINYSNKIKVVSENLLKSNLFSAYPGLKESVVNQISAIQNLLEKLQEFLKSQKLPQSKNLDKILGRDFGKGGVSKLNSAMKIWIYYYKNSKDDEDKASAARAFLDLKKIKETLENHQGRSFAELREFFEQNFGNSFVKSPEELDNYLTQVYNYAQNIAPAELKTSLTKENNENVYLTKFADIPGMPKLKTGPQISQTLTPGKPTNQPSLKKTDLTESGKAVQRMQLLLRNLASWLVSSSEKNANDVNLLMRVGPETKDPTLFDGSWGPNTNKAVETASKYTQKYLQKKLELGPMMGKPEEEIKNKANTNSNLLAALLQKVGYAGLKELGISSNEVIYDKIHKGFNITTVEDLNGTIPLKTTDLSSLKSLYNFIKTNGIYTGIDDGITLKDWDDALKWLINRAMFKYKSAKNTKEIGLATAYYRNAVDLAYNFYGLVQKFNRSIQENPEIAIHPDDLEGSAGMGGKNFGFMPGGKLDKSKLQLISGPAGTNDPYSLQGQQKLVAQNPITRDYLFLNSDAPNGNPWFDPNLNYKAPLSKGIFNKNAVVVAQSLFGNLAGDESYMINTFLNQNPVFKLLSDSPNGPIVLDSRDQVRKYLNNIPEYQNAKLKLQNQLPILAYQMFLRNLINQLTTVYNKWIEVVGPVPQTAAQVQEYQQEWLQGINRHLNDLKEYAANRTLRPSRF